MTRTRLSVRAIVATIPLLSIGTLMSPTINAQVLRAGADGERFDVASIKPTTRAQVPMPQVHGDVVQISGVTLSDLIRFAPTAHGQVVVDKAPGWTTKDRFDVLAKPYLRRSRKRARGRWRDWPHQMSDLVRRCASAPGSP